MAANKIPENQLCTDIRWHAPKSLAMLMIKASGILRCVTFCVAGSQPSPSIKHDVWSTLVSVVWCFGFVFGIKKAQTVSQCPRFSISCHYATMPLNSYHPVQALYCPYGYMQPGITVEGSCLPRPYSEWFLDPKHWVFWVWRGIQCGTINR